MRKATGFVNNNTNLIILFRTCTSKGARTRIHWIDYTITFQSDDIVHLNVLGNMNHSAANMVLLFREFMICRKVE